MRAGYKVTLRDYGEADAEVTWGRSGLWEGKKTVRGQSSCCAVCIARCVRRAKAAVRRKIMAAKLDHLLTLAYRENVTDKAKASADFERFIRHVREYYRDWPYAMVPERQERGALHFHLAVRGFQDVGLLRALWRGIVGEGNIDVQYRKTDKGAKWKKADLARYLAKYVGKDLESKLNERRYRCSLGIEVPADSTLIPSWARVKEYALQRLRDAAGCVSWVWEPEGQEHGWACSWG